MAIENTGQFKGIYHVLGGIISPFEGKGPTDLTLAPLIAKAESGTIKEIIFALPANMEGDTTCFYLYKKLKPFVDTFTTIARGIAIGEELEYTDELTLGRSIMNRTSYEMPLNNKNWGFYQLLSSIVNISSWRGSTSSKGFKSSGLQLLR